MKKLATKILISFLVIFLGISGGLILNHNIRKSTEKSLYMQTLGENLKTVTVKNKNMSCYVQGSGEKTIVLLSGYGTPSPIANFMPLSDELSKNYKVVTIEYFGYGFSDNTYEERTNDNFVEEIRLALKELNIEPPYILMPHSFSGIYSMHYANKYPKEIEAIIGLDDSKPNQMKQNSTSIKQKWQFIKNWFGIYRIIDWSNPSYMEEMFFKGINKNIYSQEMLDLMHIDFVWHYDSIPNINEENMMYSNAKELFDVKYPDNLPVLSIVCSRNAEKQDLNWVGLHEEVMSNRDIQKLEILEGRHYIHYNQVSSIVDLTDKFLKSIE